MLKPREARHPLARLPLAAAFALLALAASSLPAAETAFDAWAEDLAEDWVRQSPQLATRAQYFAGAEQDAADRRLSLFSTFGDSIGITAARSQAALARRALAELDRFRPEDLSQVQRSSAALIRWTMEDEIARAEFATHRPVFHQMAGALHLEFINSLTQIHPIRTRRDVENYLARLEELPVRMDEGVADARTAAEAGVIPPGFILQRTIAQFNDFIAAPPASNVLVTSLNGRMATMPEQLPDEERATFIRAAEKTTKDRVVPAFRRARDLLASQLPRATDDAGVWRLPRGDAFHARELAHYTTTRLSAEQIHRIGLEEVARIEAEMDGLLRKLGFSDGTLQQRIELLNASMLPTGDDPRPAILAEVEQAVRDAERRARSSFGLQPKAPVIVRREPAISEASAAAHYVPLAPDGSRPGIYFLPLADLGPRLTWLGAGLKSTAYHEAVPGHHFQLTIQQESRTLPKYRKLGAFGFISAYGEGWALYAERLADENGWYTGDPRSRLGYLNMQLFRARRLVVDTGIHAMRWTRRQAIDYGITPAEVERYIVWPGQACSYIIRQLKLVEMREHARAALGVKFSDKDFHDLVLGLGNVPLDVLSGEVEVWIEDRQASSG